MQVLKVDLQSPDASEQFVKSLRGTGFAVLTNHSIDYKMVEEIHNEWKAFFASDDKFDYKFKRNYEHVQDGYFPMDVAEVAKGAEVKDIKEFYHCYPCKPLPKSITEKTLILRKQLLVLGKQLLQWIEDNTPEDIRQTLSMPLTKMVDEDQQTLLRILHYPPIPAEVESGAIRAAAHEDINLITLLVSATAAGLQVKDTAGNWHEVPCDKASIAVNVGDMLQEATQGYFRSTTHQVVNPEGDAAAQSRFSFPLFIHARSDVRLSDRCTAGEYLRERLAELGLLEEES